MVRGCRVRGIIGIVAAVVMAVPLTQHAWADTADSPGLDEAQRMFYNGRYADAATLTADLCTAEADDLAACELRTSALLFQLRRALGESPDKDKAFTQCAACPALLSTFVAETRRVQAIARARLEVDPGDEETLFFLGKLDLNYVWLQLGTLGRKTGWDEYLGGATVARQGAEAESPSRAGQGGARLDRLHRGHEDATGHAVAARRREQEAWPACGARGRNRRGRSVRARRGRLRAVGHAGAGAEHRRGAGDRSHARRGLPGQSGTPQVSRGARAICLAVIDSGQDSGGRPTNPVRLFRSEQPARGPRGSTLPITIPAAT